MDKEQLRGALAAAARQVLEDAAFVFTEEADAPTDESAWSTAISQVYLPFVGPTCGRFMLAASSRLGESLAAEMIAADPGSPESEEEAEDSLRELLNMISGATLEEVFREEPWEMAVPELRQVSPAEYLAIRLDADVWVHLDTEDADPLELAVFLGKGEPR
jgi:CheY-specific phosphatase CheX